MARDGLWGRALDLVESTTGLTIAPVERLDQLTETAERFREFRDEAEELAYSTMDYFSGRPQEMRREKRNRLAQRSRIALINDPLAGAEASLLANFAFGRGVSPPTSDDEEVQKVLMEAWTDPVNRAKLTGFEAQRHRSNDLITQANLLPMAFSRGGRVRLAFLDVDTVTDIVTDPDDDERPLWYVARRRKIGWDFDNDRPSVVDEMRDDVLGWPIVRYYEHWRNVEDARAERETAKPGDDLEALEEPPEEKLGVGQVEHFRINRIGRTQWGTPPWARTLRFFSAMNQLTEAHVSMARAKSSIIAKRVQKGSPRQIVDAANMVLSQTGELAASSFGSGFAGDATAQGLAGKPPVAPGSFWTENPADNLQAVNLSSGAAEAAQTAQIVRAPIAAAANFGQHYLGDASNANLATATTLELPALMNIGAWQETFEELFRWFFDLSLQEAVRSGRLGGYDKAADEMLGKTLSELRLSEAADKAEAERRTGKKLDYTFEMPYPGRRNLPDVVAMVTGISTSYDPNGVNIPLRRALLHFLAVHGLQMADADAFVDAAVPEDTPLPGGIGPAPAPGIDPETGQQVQIGDGKPDDEKSQYGEKRRGTPPSDEMGEQEYVPDELVALLGKETGEVRALFDEIMADPAVAAALPASNGNGRVPGH